MALFAKRGLRACVLVSALAACGDSGGGDGVEGGDGGPGSASTGGSGASSSGGSGSGDSDDHVLWTASSTGSTLRAYDMKGDPLLSVELSGAPTALIVAEGLGIVGTDGGDLYAIASDSGLGDLFEPAKPEPNGKVGAPIEALAASPGTIWAAHLGGGTSDLPPEVVRVSLSDGSEQSRRAVIPVNENHENILYDGSAVWVISGNGFGLIKLDVSNGEVIKRVELGESPDDPMGPRGEFYGYGDGVIVGDRIWVIDDYNKKLLELSRTDMSLSSVRDILPLLDKAGAWYLATDGKDMFLSQSDLDAIVRLDGTTGEVVRTYENQNGVGRLAVVDGRIYTDADESFGDVEVIDLESGEVVKTFPGVYADYLAVQ